MWNEQDHPRDDDGKFTFKNGGYTGNDSENSTPVLKGRIEKTEVKSPAEILYGDTHKKEKEEKEYRSNLLNVLGDLATPTMILYATNKELGNEIRKNGLINTAKKAVNVALNSKPAQKAIRNSIGGNYDERTNQNTRRYLGQDTAGMLDLAHGINMNDRDYIKDIISLDNYNDPKVASDKEYLKKKVSEQFKDYNFDINKIKGYFFKSDSEPVQRLIENKDF